MRPIKPEPSKTVAGGRGLPTRGLPQHLADIRVGGLRLGDMGNAEIARICVALNVTGAGHMLSKLRNVELLTAALEAIGREAAERAIAEHVAAKLGRQP